MSRFEELLKNVRYKSHEFEFLMDANETYVQVIGRSRGEWWSGRKWRLSPHMTDGEFIQTVFAAVLAFMEHETREEFLFRGRAIFGPHISLGTLWERAEEIEERKNETNNGKI